MHDTALLAGNAFARTFGKPGDVVVDVGGQNVNGSLRAGFEAMGMKYISVDMEPHSSVDVVVKPGDPLPFETQSVDCVVSTSCFEHDPCFWMTFREMCRIVKVGGRIYVNAPAQGAYHCHPGDNWRFYADAGQALAVWSKRALVPGGEIYPAVVEETFHIMPLREKWVDFVCVWRRVADAADISNDIIVLPKAGIVPGPLQLSIRSCGASTVFPFPGT